MSIAHKYYGVYSSSGSASFTCMLIDAHKLILTGEATDYSCANTILQEILDNYEEAENKVEFAQKFQLSEQDIKDLEILKDEVTFNDAIRKDPLASMKKEKARPNVSPYDGVDQIYSFIEEYAKLNRYANTLIALKVASEMHSGQKRKGGDPYIIHPLCVTLRIIYSGTDDDITCAAALLHEVFKKCGVRDGGEKLIKKYGLDPEVFELVKLVSKPEDMSKDEYYEKMKGNYKALLIKLSNRANTCTILNTYTPEEIDEYMKECEEYIYPLCEYGVTHYKEYAHKVNIMHIHITQISSIVAYLTHLTKTDSNRKQFNRK